MTKKYVSPVYTTRILKMDGGSYYALARSAYYGEVDLSRLKTVSGWFNSSWPTQSNKIPSLLRENVCD